MVNDLLMMSSIIICSGGLSGVLQAQVISMVRPQQGSIFSYRWSMYVAAPFSAVMLNSASHFGQMNIILKTPGGML